MVIIVAAAQVAYIITWQIYTGGAGEGGGFQSNSVSTADANWPFQCKVASLLSET